MSIYDQWQAGDLTDQEALRLLADEYAEIEEVYVRTTQARDERRAQLSEVVAHMGDRASAGAYEFRITSPSTTVSYDSKALDALVAELTAANDPLAQRLATLRTTRLRSGGLRIEHKRD